MAAGQSDSTGLLAIVDDDVAFQSIVSQVAEPFGWQVFGFTNGRELIDAIARSLRPDLIVLDMVMPEFDGIETIGAIGAISVRCPVVLITGRMPAYTRSAHELGQANGIEIIDILQKPVPLKHLQAVLDPEHVFNRQ
jgi:CheY-like chemotaxis protein